MCVIHVAIFMLGLKGMNYQDLQLVDANPCVHPAACWVRWAEQKGADDQPVISHAVCVDSDKHIVYKGRVAEPLQS